MACIPSPGFTLKPTLVQPEMQALEPLLEGALGRSRYDLRLHMDKGKRYRLRVG